MGPRAGARALIFSKEAPHVLWGMSRRLWSFGALPWLMVWRRPPDRRLCRVLWLASCRLAVLPGGRSASEGRSRAVAGNHGDELRAGPAGREPLDFQLQLDAWFEKANARTHKTLRGRPIDRLVEERQVMRALPDRAPDVDRPQVVGVPTDPHLRSIPTTTRWTRTLLGRRVEVRVSQREVVAVARSTQASSRAAMNAASRSTARSPRSSTPVRWSGRAHLRAARRGRAASGHRRSRERSRRDPRLGCHPVPASLRAVAVTA